MLKQGLESLLRTNEDDLARIRETLFPAISDGTITGYNIYENCWVYEPGKLYVNYLHAHLGHILNLSAKLEQDIEDYEGISEGGIKERHATYVTEPSWDTQLGVRYFNEKGEEKSRKEAESRPIFTIGETLQYDWLIALDSQKNLRKTIDFLKKFASKNIMDRRGKIKKDKLGRSLRNRFAVQDSWEIPFVTLLGTEGTPKLRDFSSVSEVIMTDVIGTKPVVISALCRKDKVEEVVRVYGNKINRIIEKYLINEGYLWIGE